MLLDEYILYHPRLLNKEDVVILDSLNYIKGFRYELFCVTKACHTPHCVIFCDISSDRASEFNLQRNEPDRYTQEMWTMTSQVTRSARRCLIGSRHPQISQHSRYVAMAFSD
ncbi:protein KTI12 homolog [Haliotis rubra]|uniref:protein KTI12 homolog n=1 Tax=Haliotis rubra TaxID=36100 RepID=UPI001EE5E21E|nr:protein KTI12 homolog [Haliotis rubra]